MDENKQDVFDSPTEVVKTRKIVKVSRRSLIIGIVIIILISLGVLYYSSLSKGIRVGMNQEATSSDIVYNDSRVVPQSPYYDPVTKLLVREGGIPSIKDTREFLKTSYNSTIKTRDVSDVIKDVKSAIREVDGRIDRLDSSEKHGFISFVIAKSKFESFKDEIESITHKKLYEENISSENLLSQKQNIEEQTTNALNNLNNLNAQKEDLNIKHNNTVNSINKEINRIQKELTSVRANIYYTTDPLILASLRNQETSYVQQDATQRRKLVEENNNYSIQLKNLENLIHYANLNLTNINKQDTQFTDNIETINGSVSVNWISLCEMAKIFSPIHPIIVIIALAIIAWFSLRRKKFVPKIVIE